METFDRYIMSANSKGSDQTAELARVAIVCFILFFFFFFIISGRGLIRMFNRCLLF